MNLHRQKSRYFPDKSDYYFDQNVTISEYLDSVKQSLIGKKILDIGAGEIPFSPFYKDLSVTTCDIQNNSTNTIDYIIGNDGSLPFQDSSYDVIFLFDVLEHVKNDVLFVTECSRILTYGGSIIATVPFMYRFHEIPYDFRRYTPSGLTNILSNASFQNIDIKKVGSVMFTAQVFLSEHQVVISEGIRKMILRLILKLLKMITVRSEISEVSPFSFFVIAFKIQRKTV
jgi:ubiquinone/menaquinone biosynthesis C-methylase UbiE